MRPDVGQGTVILTWDLIRSYSILGRPFVTCLYHCSASLGDRQRKTHWEPSEMEFWR